VRAPSAGLKSFRQAGGHKIVGVFKETAQSYVTCSCCGAKSIDDATLARVIAKARDAEDFLALTERARHQPH
jgi:hypothetical protein